MSQPFFESVNLSGGKELVAAFKKLDENLKKATIERVATRTLERIAAAMRSEINSISTNTDKGFPGDRLWPYMRRGRMVSPGLARAKVSTAIAVIPLGSKQRRLYIGRRIGVTGKSGAFYGRLIEKGFSIVRKGRMRGWVKGKKDIPGKWVFFRLFKRLKPGAEATAVQEFTDFINEWGRIKSTPSKDQS
jgi:hypothetical protein